MSFDLADCIRELNLTNAPEQSTTNHLMTPDDDDDEPRNTFPINGAARRPNHTVEYQYPVISLLPDGRNLHLPRPVSAQYRQHPGANNLGVDMSTPAFFTISPLNGGRKPAGPSSSINSAFKLSLEDRMAYGLITDMENLLYAPGRTTLQLVTFKRKRELYFRVKRETRFADGSTEEALYQFSQEGWGTLGQPLGYDGEDRAWLRLLDNLYLRASDLACIHVHKQLVSQGRGEFAAQEAEGIRWSRRSKWNAVDFLLDHMLYRGEDANGKTIEVRLRRRYIESLPREIKIMLPCGDFEMIKRSKLAAIDPNSDYCPSFACLTCRTLVLTKRDAMNMEVISDGEKREARAQQVDWEELDGPITSDVQKTLLASSIAASMELARESFTVASSVIPMMLAPESCEETNMVLSALEAELATHHLLPASPVSLHRKFVEFTDEILVGDAREHGYTGSAADLPTPPGWLVFAERWFRRTVNFVFCRECDGTPGGCRGQHWHEKDDRTYWNPTFEAPDDGEDDESDDEDGGQELPDDDVFEVDAEGNRHRVLQQETDAKMDNWCSNGGS
ncbi:hypothetical protein LTR85_003067 [Meristemomyces frigidus]|nr:hypothetical protein LTR85_003067 [Meristemomyces frigidus]